MPESTTWVLIADGSRARLFEHDRSERTLALLHEHDRPELRDRDAQRYADRPGRVHERANQARHAMEPPTAISDSAREGFARELVEHLRTGAQEHRFGRLIIAAPPAMLGVLRDQLDEQLRDKLVAELHKDLTKIHAQELPEHLSEWITVDPPPRTRG